jgi:hypothetical protein
MNPIITSIATELCWELSIPIWNNDGDAYFYDNNGKLVSTLGR